MFILFILFPASLFSVITCQFNGRLGNQLFQIAATMSLAEDLGTQPVFFVNKKANGIRNNYTNVYPLIPVSKRSLMLKPFEEKDFHNSPHLLVDGIKLVGYYQSEKYFIKHKEKILSYFQPSNSIVKRLWKKHEEILTHPHSVAVHVRCYFNEGNDTATNFCVVSKEYFLKAMDLFPKDSLFIFFSDDIKFCRKIFEEELRNIVFIEGQKDYEDFYLMSLCKHNIISNSTFSWWAAYLNKNPDKVVVAPNYWHGENISSDLADEIIPEEWIRVDFDRKNRITGYPVSI